MLRGISQVRGKRDCGGRRWKELPIGAGNTLLLSDALSLRRFIPPSPVLLAFTIRTVDAEIGTQVCCF